MHMAILPACAWHLVPAKVRRHQITGIRVTDCFKSPYGCCIKPYFSE